MDSSLILKIKKRSYKISHTLTILSSVYLFIILYNIDFINQDIWQYYITGIYIISAILLIFLTKTCVKIYNGIYTRVSIIMLVMYIYGLLIGILNGNNYIYIIRNFAGMSVYSVGFILLNSKIKEETIVRILKGISAITPFVVIIIWINENVFHYVDMENVPWFNQYQGNILFVTRETIYIIYGISLYRIIVQKKKIIRSIVFIIATLLSVVTFNNTDGDLLAIIMLTIIIFLVFAKKNRNKFFVGFAVGLLFLIPLYCILYSEEMIISKIFSMNDGGNLKRLEEIKYIFGEDFAVLGNGLGASVGNLGTRGLNYGTEVIYANLFHKFGVFALIILYAYVITIIKAIKVLYRSENDENDIIPLMCMGYLFPSLANPMLFGVSVVLMHCIALILIDNRLDNDAFKNY